MIYRSKGKIGLTSIPSVSRNEVKVETEPDRSKQMVLHHYLINDHLNREIDFFLLLKWNSYGIIEHIGFPSFK